MFTVSHAAICPKTLVRVISNLIDVFTWSNKGHNNKPLPPSMYRGHTGYISCNLCSFPPSNPTELTPPSLICVLSTEGLAVGVGFGAIGKTPSATFESAR